MAPNATSNLKQSPPCQNVENTNTKSLEITKVLYETDVDPYVDEKLAAIVETTPTTPQRRKPELVWRNLIAFGILHVSAVYGAWLMFTSAKWQTNLFVAFLYLISGFGVTAGAHRLWAHRTYKATWQFKLMVIIFNTVAFEDAVYDWARDHRVHHKYAETDADPHNATRGFFFSHMGWLLCKKHPDVKAKGKNVDMSDLEKEPIVMFQKKHYLILMPIATFIIPTIVPMYYWDESFVNSWFVATMFRWCIFLHATWLVNSAAHIYGYKSYEKAINPTENFGVSVVTLGEGWHNYHHVFPWDYKAAEWPGSLLNFTTFTIDLFSRIGWTYDKKSVSKEMIEKRVRRTGDGSHPIWGWGDKDITKEEKEAVRIANH
ncbi:acyl-CoA Delta-9 desaturase-like [Episyrphus balteatus]|uniref:acyl-CoA Delta-9 desaturase-like n=1 Tax=Episyrphus balteatus TaxID=286459 RepID=UPI0024851EED|nr:acyl-CoA Delta-9 desaturase-like [Episyrphus balteatus]